MGVSSEKQNQKKGMDNRGLTLMEVLVVIGLMTLMSTIAIVSTSMLNGKEAQKCSAALESELNSVRITTMGTAEATARIYKNSSDNCYYVEVISTLNGKVKKENKMIGNKKVTLYYTNDEPVTKLGAVKPPEIDTTGITISFNRSSGAMNCSYRGIYVEQGDRLAVIYLYPETGKIKLKKTQADK